MAERYYYTADGVAFPGPTGVDKEPYPENFEGRLPATPPGNGTYVSRLRSPQENIGLYQAIQAVSGCLPSNYFDPRLELAMVGPLLTAGTRVQETWFCDQIPIADLYLIKRQEIAGQDNLVRFNALDTVLNANWWLILTEDARFSLQSLGMAANLRKINSQAWPSGPNQPYVGIYNANTQDARRFQIDETTWDALLIEWAQRDQATDAATDASRSSLDTKYNDGAGDWQTVADHDAADPAWNYPATVDPAELQAAVS